MSILVEDVAARIAEEMVTEGLFGIKPNTTLKMVTVKDSSLLPMFERSISIYGGSSGRYDIAGNRVHSMAKNAKITKHTAYIIDLLVKSGKMTETEATTYVNDGLVVTFTTAQDLWEKIRGLHLDTQAMSNDMWKFVLKQRSIDKGEKQ